MAPSGNGRTLSVSDLRADERTEIETAMKQIWRNSDLDRHCEER
jgi:hypothetical protein